MPWKGIIMKHILTCHVYEDSWIDLQVDHFKKHTNLDYKIYSVYDCVSKEEFDTAVAAMGTENFAKDVANSFEEITGSS